MVSILPVDTNWDAAVSFALMVLSIVLLVVLLVVKELALSRGKQWQVLGQMLNVAIVPLLITFSVTILVQILGTVP
jgi:uncharacterized membrane protein